MHESNLLMSLKKLTSDLSLNPSDKGSVVTLSNNNMRARVQQLNAVRGTIGRNTGKWYCEFKIIQQTGASTYSCPIVGIATPATGLTSPWGNGGQEMLAYSYTSGTRQGVLMYGINQTRPALGWNFIQGNNVGIALDLDTGNLIFYRDGVFMSSHSIAVYSVPGSTFYPMIASGNSAATDYTIADLLAGATLEYRPPFGFLPW